MSTNWTTAVCATLASAAVLTGCNQDQNRTAIDNATNQQKQNHEITVSGCLGTGIGTQQLMLTAVQLAPLGEQPSDTASNRGNPITPNAQVRLAMEDRDQLERLVGQKVTVTGIIKDDGRNTIGTSGTDGQTPAQGRVDPQADKSQAASTQHHSDKVAQEAGPIGQRSMNNGNFPELTVVRIQGSGEKCSSWPVQERR